MSLFAVDLGFPDESLLVLIFVVCPVAAFQIAMLVLALVVYLDRRSLARGQIIPDDQGIGKLWGQQANARRPRSEDREAA